MPIIMQYFFIVFTLITEALQKHKTSLKSHNVLLLQLRLFCWQLKKVRICL